MLAPILAVGCGDDGGTTSDGEDCEITVLSPNGGESYAVGDSVQVTWDSSADCGETVGVYLLADGEECLELAGDAPNSGLYVWRVSRCGSDGASGYSIRVIDRGSEIHDDSGLFSIAPAGNGPKYVALGGDDEGPGTESEPWRTIQKAAATLVAGETVYVKTGTYNERVVPANSGSEDQFITFMANPGEEVTIDGQGIVLPQDGGGLFEIEEKAYIKVSGFRIVNAGPYDNDAGILVSGSNNVVIESNYTYNTVSSGIAVWNSSDVTVHNNEIELACNDGEQECLTIATTAGFVVSGNYVHDGGPGNNGGEGIDIKDGSSNGSVFDNRVHDVARVGIYLDAWDKHTYGIAVYRNVVYDIRDGVGFSVASESGGLLEDVSLYNNIAYDNPLSGIDFDSCCEQSATHPVRNIKVINNTFFRNGSAVWGGGITIQNPDASDIVIRNNIFSQNIAFQIGLEAIVENLSIDHNLIDGYRGYEYETRGTDYVEGEARFVDTVLPDLHLQSDSPAIDRGSAIDAPADDFEGNPRPQAGGFDIGAFESTARGLRPAR